MPTKKSTQEGADIVAAAKTGDRLQTLVALRDLLAEKLQNTASSRDVAAVSRRLMQAVNEIEILEKERKAQEENTFSLYDFRREIRRQHGEMQKTYNIGSIAAEHEVH